MARVICHGKHGRIQQPFRQGQEDQLAALGLVLNAVILWNTRYLDAAVTELRQSGTPTGWTAVPRAQRWRSRPARTFPYYCLSNQWQRIKRSEGIDIPEGMVMYGFRHFFASNCLSIRIPITDVAEWMGHNSIDVTFKIYRHLMPGSIGRAAKLLDVGLTA
nr:Tn3 family transposase [Streptomyces niveus]